VLINKFVRKWDQLISFGPQRRIHVKTSGRGPTQPTIFYTKTLYTHLPCSATCPAHFMLLHLIAQKILDEEHRSLSSSLCSFLSTPLLPHPLRPKYSPQHPILKHPQPALLPQCKRQVFTPIQQNTKLYFCISYCIYF